MKTARGGRALAAALGAAVSLTAGLVSCARAGEEVVVFAAASLTEAMTQIAEAFEAAHPGAAVLLNLGPSDGLAAQIAAGAPADVFAAAGPAPMDALAARRGVEARAVFARNRLVIVTPRANPAGIRGIDDLARPGVALVLAARGVPAGDYARDALGRAGIAGRAERNVVSNEPDVKGALGRVAAGEADASIVYATDVTAAIAARVRSLPLDADAVAAYPIAVVGDAPHRALALEFVRFVIGDGRTILSALGFMPA